VKKATGLSERIRGCDPLLKRLRLAFVVCCFWPMLSHGVNLALDESASQRIEKLLKDGRQAEAEKEIQLAQTADSGNFRVKFLHCVLQAQQAAPKKAISCFQQWVQEYPDGLEAYNNIGVLYAGMGMQVEARQWFERGLQRQQAYATLHQNLLNLQAEMNYQAYAAALQLDMAKSTVTPKLILLGRITSLPEQQRAALPAVAVSASGKSGAASEPALAPLSAKSKQTHQAPVAASAAPVQEVLTAQDLAQQTRVKDAVLAWSLAWRQKDLDAYLQAYAPGFDPGSKVSRSAWEEQRRSRILSKKQIHIELSQFKIHVSTANANAKATATFVQHYASGTVVTVSRKTLELIEDKGRWLIVREFVNGA
jgi:tetratricopeptide (TPR) repeat protein